MLYLQGPLYKIKVKFVSGATVQKYLKPAKGEVVLGAFIPSSNQILVKKDLPAEEKLHILMHEWAHAVEHQTSGLGEEQRCDVLGMFLTKLTKAKTVEELINDYSGD